MKSGSIGLRENQRPPVMSYKLGQLSEAAGIGSPIYELNRHLFINK